MTNPSIKDIDNLHILKYMHIFWDERVTFNFWGFSGPTLVLFLFYVNVTGIRLRSRLSSNPLAIPAPRVKWSNLCFSTPGDCLSFPWVK